MQLLAMNKNFSICQFIFVAILFIASIGHATDDDGRSADLLVLKKAYTGKLTDDQLVPKRFVAAGQTKGDLNGDGIADVALILHRELAKKKSSKKNSDDDSEDSYDLPQFVILFTGTAEKRYELWKLGEHHFTNSMSNQMSENGLSLLSIDKSMLTVTSDFAMSMGGWSAGGCTQKWRNNKSGFELIGLTVNSTNRKCGECGTYSDTNFSSHKQIIKKISDDPENPKTTTSTKKTKEDPIGWEKFKYDVRCSTNAP